MTYQLVARDGADAASGRWLGEHPDFDTALAAVHADVLNLMAAAQGGWVTVWHDIVGPGALGEHTPHPVVTHLGPEEDDDLEAALTAADGWLTEARLASTR